MLLTFLKSFSILSKKVFSEKKLFYFFESAHVKKKKINAFLPTLGPKPSLSSQWSLVQSFVWDFVCISFVWLTSLWEQSHRKQMQKKSSNAWVVKIGEGSGPRGPLPEIGVHYLNLDFQRSPLVIENQFSQLNSNRGQLQGSTTFSNFDGPGIHMMFHWLERLGLTSHFRSFWKSYVMAFSPQNKW